MMRLKGDRIISALSSIRSGFKPSPAHRLASSTRAVPPGRLSRVRYAVGMDSPEMIIRPRPPKPTLGDKEQLYLADIRERISLIMTTTRKFDAEDAKAIISGCIKDSRLRVLPYIVIECLDRNITLDSDTLVDLFERFTSHYMFDAACVVGTQLVKADVDQLDPSLVSLALAGSMTAESVGRAMGLLLAIVEARRGDLLVNVDSVKVALPDDRNSIRRTIELSAADCSRGVDIFVAALREGWYSPACCRLFVSMLLMPQVSGGNLIERFFSEAVAIATETGQNLMPIVHTFGDIPPPSAQNRGGKEVAQYGRIISRVMDVLNDLVQSNSDSLRSDPTSSSTSKDCFSVLGSPLQCENFLKLFWKTASLAQRYDRPTADRSASDLANSINDLHASLKEFKYGDALAATYSIPWGHQRRSFRVLVDLLDFNHKVRDKEVAVDLMKINVFKDGGPRRKNTVVQFAPVESLVTTNRLREDISPYKLAAPPPEWQKLSVLLASSVDTDTLMLVLASVLQTMKDRHSHPVWALSMLEYILSKSEPTEIPGHVIEGVLQMCMYKTDIYSMLELLGLVRERGIKLSESTWSKVLVVVWTGGTRHMTPLVRDRVFVQVLELIKQCSGTLDGPSVAVLMRYLFFKKEKGDIFLYKIIDRLFKDKTQDITFKECVVLCACLYKRIEFLSENKHFELSSPLFATSRFIVASELGEIKLYEEMCDLVSYFPDGFFGRFAEVWPTISSRHGRVQLYALTESLLYDEQVSFLITVPANDHLMNVLSILSVYTAFLVAHNDKQHRRAYDMLHRISTLHKQFEENKRKNRLFEYSCPRKYKYSEPFSHFSFGWIEGGSDEAADGSVIGMDDGKGLSSSDVSSSEPAAGGVLTANDLRLRAEGNVSRETVRGIDVRRPNQSMQAASVFRSVERLRFIPERS